MRRWFAFAAVLSGVAGIAVVGCTSEAPSKAPQSSAPEPASRVYSVSLTASTPSDLPECTADLAGNTAYVTSPASLWSCIADQWMQIPCTTALGGAVAYASTTNTLWACVAGQWTEVALPDAGPPGPQGPAGPPGDAGAESLIVTTPEPPGPNCAAGGVRIDVGVDTNGDGVLEPSEVQQTAYVCNGATGASADGGAGPCTPNTLGCRDQQPQQCSADGQWQDVGPSCASLNEACVSGACVGICVPAASRCATGGVQTCAPNGQWGAAQACTTSVANATATCANGACNGFACNAGYTQCGSASCLDLQNDPSNCGACGHTCARGCSGGACTAIALETRAPKSWGFGGMALDSTSVYWTDDSVVKKAPKGGGASPIILAGVPDDPNFPRFTGIAVDATNVYWTSYREAGGVFQAPIGGGGPAVLTAAAFLPVSLAIGYTQLGITTTEYILYTNATGLMWMPLGGTPTVLESVHTGSTPIRVHLADVYWIGYDHGYSLMTASLLFGSATTIASLGSAAPLDLAADFNNVYWIEQGPDGATGAVKKIPVGGGSPVTLATIDAGAPTSIAVDANSLYWTLSTGRVMKMPLGGGPPVTLAGSNGKARGIVVDSANVYWFDDYSVLEFEK